MSLTNDLGAGEQTWHFGSIVSKTIRIPELACKYCICPGAWQLRPTRIWPLDFGPAHESRFRNSLFREHRLMQRLI